MTKTAKRAKTAGAYKAGHGGRHVFDLYSLKRVDAGGKTGTVDHYADTRAAVIEGERMQVGLAFEKAGCGARPHTHPNEQFNFVVKGTLMADIAGRKTMKVPAGSVVYFPANVVHRTYATPDEDVIFYVVKDLSHGIAGRPVKRVKAGGAHYVRAEQERQTVTTRTTRRSGESLSGRSRSKKGKPATKRRGGPTRSGESRRV